MRRIFFVIIIFSSICCNAQSSEWQIEPEWIFSYHFTENSPKSSSFVGTVKPHHSVILRDIGLGIYKKSNNNLSYGIRFFNQEYTYGYRPQNNGTDSGLSIATGMTWSHFDKRIIQWNIEPILKWSKQISAKSKVHFHSGIQFGWLPFSSIFIDTNYKIEVFINDVPYIMSKNEYQRLNLSPTKYIKHPSYQNNKLRLQLSIGVGWEKKISNHLGYGFILSYRQGFSTLFIDNTEIWVNYFTNPKSELFHTKITGTGLQLCNRLIIYLNN